MAQNIQNIIFDLGGVLLNIDYQATVLAFQKLGLENPLEAFTKEHQAALFQDFETGKISSEAFVDALQEKMPQASEEMIVHAWNAMLGDFPIKRFKFIQSLQGKYRCFVLSNTNAIHQTAFEDIIEETVGWKAFEGLFDTIYYSHYLGMRKPDAEIFEEVLRRHHLVAAETCFIDDSIQHVKTAKTLGIQAIHLDGGQEIWDVIK